jgi:hypothetical protein
MTNTSTPVTAEAPAEGALWPGDLGTLPIESRRTLVQLVHGPYLSARRHPNLWAALARDEAAIRSRLADLLLDVVVDHDSEVAFIRNAAPTDHPQTSVVRTAPLTFIQTALLILLRKMLLTADSGERVYADLDEATDQLEVYREGQGLDQHAFGKRVGAAWTKLHEYGLLHSTGTEGRSEVSQMLRLVFGPDEIEALIKEYRRIADTRPAFSAQDDVEHSDDAEHFDDTEQSDDADHLYDTGHPDNAEHPDDTEPQDTMERPKEGEVG